MFPWLPAPFQAIAAAAHFESTMKQGNKEADGSMDR